MAKEAHRLAAGTRSEDLEEAVLRFVVGGEARWSVRLLLLLLLASA